VTPAPTPQPLTVNQPAWPQPATTISRPAPSWLSTPVVAGLVVVVILVISGAIWAVTRRGGGPVVVTPGAEQLVTMTIAGDGDTAVLSSPSSLAIDGSGRIYVADRLNHRIRVITPERSISTLAGSGTAGFINATGASAQFNEPFGIAVDAGGKVYVADTENHRIRTITPQGVVATLAGTGREGSTDGAGNIAQFSFPAGVRLDSAGNLYVADFGNSKVRKILPNGNVTTLAGSGVDGFADGLRNAAQFDGPRSLAVDAAGNVYVTDQNNHRIRKITPDGAVTTVAGSGLEGFADGPAADAQFASPSGIAIDPSGNLYIADLENRRIRKISPDGTVTTLAGSGAQGSRDGAAMEAQFGLPQDVAIDGAGNLYVADEATHRIRVITSASNR
jgi:sugar lactone lactonase YvrE